MEYFITNDGRKLEPVYSGAFNVYQILEKLYDGMWHCNSCEFGKKGRPAERVYKFVKNHKGFVFDLMGNETAIKEKKTTVKRFCERCDATTSHSRLLEMPDMEKLFSECRGFGKKKRKKQKSIKTVNVNINLPKIENEILPQPIAKTIEVVDQFDTGRRFDLDFPKDFLDNVMRYEDGKDEIDRLKCKCYYMLREFNNFNCKELVALSVKNTKLKVLFCTECQTTGIRQSSIIRVEMFFKGDRKYRGTCKGCFWGYPEEWISTLTVMSKTKEAETLYPVGYHQV